MTRKQWNTPKYRADKRIIVYTDPEVKRQLRERCEREGKTLSQLAAEILRAAIS